MPRWTSWEIYTWRNNFCAFAHLYLKPPNAYDLWTTDAMYIRRNSEACSRYDWRRGKAISITHSVCVRVRRCGCTGSGVRFHACSLTHPACNAHAPWSLRPLWLHQVFGYYLINGTIFGEKSQSTKCVFSFSLQLYLKHLLFYEEFSEILS
jgi:hypothetical protein